MPYSYPIGRRKKDGYAIFLDPKIRRQHIHVPGQTGSGKSTLLVNMMLADLKSGRGFAFLDPNGQTADQIAALIPPERMKDVIYLDPLHPEKVATYNPYKGVPRLFKHTLATIITMAFKRIYADVWGPRMDVIMKMAIHLQLEVPGSTLGDLSRLLLDEEYRATLLAQCPDAEITKYWTEDIYKLIPKRSMGEALQPIASKVAEFEYNPILRDIIAQPSTIDISYIINNRKILICNLSKVMGDAPSDILGSLLVAGFAQAAQDRETIPEEQRQDFSLYVDEFQNFTTSAFATMLSEARKYRLNLVLAHQYLDQLPELIPQAIMGNVGTTIAYRIGPYDSELFARFFAVNEQELLTLSNYYAYVRTSRGDAPSTPELVAMHPPAVPVKGLARMRAVKRRTRDFYARPRLPPRKNETVKAGSAHGRNVTRRKRRLS